MRKLFFLISFILTGCSGYIDSNNVEIRSHALRYFKGTNNLVSGKVVTRSNQGKIILSMNYVSGKAVGEWYQYFPDGKVASHGFGTEIKKYEKDLDGLDLTYSILSIVTVKEDFNYATLYMDNNKLFAYKEKLIHLANDIFKDYSNEYKFDDLLIFNDGYAFTISKKPKGSSYIFDTIPHRKVLTINVH